MKQSEQELKRKTTEKPAQPEWMLILRKLCEEVKSEQEKKYAS